LVVLRSALSRPGPLLAGAVTVVLPVLLVPLVLLVLLVLLFGPPQAVTRQAAAAIAAPAAIMRPLLDI
jgi:hypothetical protein